MASKMIAIKEEIYNKLSKLKKANQSFSDIIERLLMKYEKKVKQIRTIDTKRYFKNINESIPFKV